MSKILSLCQTFAPMWGWDSQPEISVYTTQLGAYLYLSEEELNKGWGMCFWSAPNTAYMLYAMTSIGAAPETGATIPRFPSSKQVPSSLSKCHTAICLFIFWLHETYIPVSTEGVQHAPISGQPVARALYGEVGNVGFNPCKLRKALSFVSALTTRIWHKRWLSLPLQRHLFLLYLF